MKQSSKMADMYVQNTEHDGKFLKKGKHGEENLNKMDVK